MLSLVATVVDKNVVEIRSSEITDGLLQAFANNYANGDLNGISYYTATSAEEVRIQNGDEYELVWTNDDITGLDFSVEDNKRWLSVSKSIAGLRANAPADLILQDVSNWSEGTYVQGDKVFRNNKIWEVIETSTTDTPTQGSSDWSQICDAVMLTLQVLTPDQSGVDTNITNNVLIPVQTNIDRFPIRADFVNGECEIILAFKNTSDCGDWYFPSEEDRVEVTNLSNFTTFEIRVVDNERLRVILPF